MFILYAIPIGLIAGLVLGGRIDRLGDVRFRLTPLAILALAIQVVLFSPLGAGLDEAVSRAIYVASTVLVAVVVVVNLRVTGVPLILLGAASNLLAIVANGGAMPASPAALASLGMGVGENTNSVVLERPAFEPLTDIFATPAWVPFSNVFSVGDVLIAAGVAIAIAAAMRRAPRMDRSDARGALPH